MICVIERRGPGKISEDPVCPQHFLDRPTLIIGIRNFVKDGSHGVTGLPCFLSPFCVNFLLLIPDVLPPWLYFGRTVSHARHHRSAGAGM